MSVPEPGKILTPWATSGLKNTIPPTADPVTGNAGYDQGFPAINMTAKEAGGIPPFGQDFNGILFSITEILRYMQAGGMPTFSSAMSSAIGGYGKGAVVLGADGVTAFQNTVDGNTSNPNSGGSGWVKDVFSGYPVGAPIPWPTSVPPSGFIAMTGQSFNATTYPKLAIAYPSLVLPDMRAEFIRGWDAGRGIDTGRAILAQQLSANLAHEHVDKWAFARQNTNPGGVNSASSAYAKTYWDPVTDAPSGTLKQSIDGTWSGPSSGLDATSSGGTESRPRNISFYYIVRAA